jgi:hypothetical protein
MPTEDELKNKDKGETANKDDDEENKDMGE